jgi:hypothetical protein
MSKVTLVVGNDTDADDESVASPRTLADRSTTLFAAAAAATLQSTESKQPAESKQTAAPVPIRGGGKGAFFPTPPEPPMFSGSVIRALSPPIDTTNLPPPPSVSSSSSSTAPFDTTPPPRPGNTIRAQNTVATVTATKTAAAAAAETTVETKQRKSPGTLQLSSYGVAAAAGGAAVSSSNGDISGNSSGNGSGSGSGSSENSSGSNSLVAPLITVGSGTAIVVAAVPSVAVSPRTIYQQEMSNTRMRASRKMEAMKQSVTEPPIETQLHAALLVCGNSICHYGWKCWESSNPCGGHFKDAADLHSFRHYMEIDKEDSDVQAQYALALAFLRGCPRYTREETRLVEGVPSLTYMRFLGMFILRFASPNLHPSKVDDLPEMFRNHTMARPLSQIEQQAKALLETVPRMQVSHGVLILAALYEGLVRDVHENFDKFRGPSLPLMLKPPQHSSFLPASSGATTTTATKTQRSGSSIRTDTPTSKARSASSAAPVAQLSTSTPAPSSASASSASALAAHAMSPTRSSSGTALSSTLDIPVSGRKLTRNNSIGSRLLDVVRSSSSRESNSGGSGGSSSSTK